MKTNKHTQTHKYRHRYTHTSICKNAQFLKKRFTCIEFPNVDTLKVTIRGWLQEAE